MIALRLYLRLTSIALGLVGVGLIICGHQLARAAAQKPRKGS